MSQPVKFVPFNSMINPGFWTALAKIKLDVSGLSEDPIPITATFTNSDPPSAGLQPRLTVDWDAFEEGDKGRGSWNSFPVKGTVTIKNTVEAFKVEDKAEFLRKEGVSLWKSIKDGSWLEKPELLTSFSVLMFADLKKYQFYYWFAFPSYNLPKQVVVKSSQTISEVLSPKQLADLELLVQTDTSVYNVMELEEEDSLHLHNLSSLSWKHKQEIILCVRDPSSSPSHPGWPVRNLIFALCYSFPDLLVKGVRIVCLRNFSKEGNVDVSHSLVLSLGVEGQLDKDPGAPSVVGWERNDKDQLLPRHANMKSSMDPAKLAEASVDLNLKLMKWRLVPGLELERLKSTRCLLLGSGTLGCGVARGLLGWGVRNITFVDNGRVSYSNPVRQSLFTFKDCLDGGRQKAEAAAERLKEIFPGVNSTGHVLSIPMPGHPISPSTEQGVKEAYDTLSQLVLDHDVIFLLMDSRESRWLPTVMAAQYPDKLVINAALGFDTFLVMRHGIRVDCEPKEQTGGLPLLVGADRLGCYFCNDVVAPGDSTTDRTLDQQCTVTRPGASGAAASLAVELAVSCITHTLGSRAPAIGRPAGADEEGAESSLGLVPHTIRGSLHGFTQVAPTGPSFSQCTACSPKVLDLHRKEGFGLMRSVGDNPKYLEDVTGLTTLMEDKDLIDSVIDLGDDDCVSLGSDI